MRWFILSVMILLISPAVAQAQTAPADKPVTQAELDQKLEQTMERLKAMMAELKNEVRGDLESTKNEALGAIKDAIESTKAKYGVTEEQLIAIGVGAMIGAIAVDLAGGGGIATMVGLMVGGAVGNWLVKPDDISAEEAGPTKKTTLRSAENTRSARVLHATFGASATTGL